MMKHIVDITSVYDELKEFCNLNNIKVIRFVHNAIKKELMLQKYGNTPFADYEMFDIDEVEEKDNTSNIPECALSADNLAFLVNQKNEVENKEKVIENETKENKIDIIIDEQKEIIEEKPIISEQPKTNKRRLK